MADINEEKKLSSLSPASRGFLQKVKKVARTAVLGAAALGAFGIADDVYSQRRESVGTSRSGGSARSATARPNPGSSSRPSGSVRPSTGSGRVQKPSGSSRPTTPPVLNRKPGVKIEGKTPSAGTDARSQQTVDNNDRTNVGGGNTNGDRTSVGNGGGSNTGGRTSIRPGVDSGNTPDRTGTGNGGLNTGGRSSVRPGSGNNDNNNSNPGRTSIRPGSGTGDVNTPGRTGVQRPGNDNTVDRGRTNIRPGTGDTYTPDRSSVRPDQRPNWRYRSNYDRMPGWQRDILHRMPYDRWDSVWGMTSRYRDRYFSGYERYGRYFDYIDDSYLNIALNYSDERLGILFEISIGNLNFFLGLGNRDVYFEMDNYQRGYFNSLPRGYWNDAFSICRSRNGRRDFFAMSDYERRVYLALNSRDRGRYMGWDRSRRSRFAGQVINVININGNSDEVVRNQSIEGLEELRGQLDEQRKIISEQDNDIRILNEQVASLKNREPEPVYVPTPAPQPAPFVAPAAAPVVSTPVAPKAPACDVSCQEMKAAVKASAAAAAAVKAAQNNLDNLKDLHEADVSELDERVTDVERVNNRQDRAIQDLQQDLQNAEQPLLPYALGGAALVGVAGLALVGRKKFKKVDKDLEEHERREDERWEEFKRQNNF